MAASQKVVVVFRSRLRPDADLAALEALGGRMYELASSMPGFLSYKDFTAADGETLTLVEFADTPSLLAWRNHPEHVRTQERGRLEFMSEYQIDVCKPERSYAFRADA
jgi:heme-degrading monooxygenase HmoA